MKLTLGSRKDEGKIICREKVLDCVEYCYCKYKKNVRKVLRDCNGYPVLTAMLCSAWCLLGPALSEVLIQLAYLRCPPVLALR